MPRPRLLPYEQGHLDGLCGVYAVINAIQLALQTSTARSSLPLPSQRLTAHDADDLFVALIDGVVLTRGNAVVGGIAAIHLPALLRVAQKWVGEYKSVTVRVRRPFLRSVRLRSGRLISSISRWLEAPGTAVIVGTDPPWCHWTVAKRVTRSRLHLLDSGGNASVPLKRGRSKRYHAGLIRPAQVYIVTIEHRSGRAVARP